MLRPDAIDRSEKRKEAAERIPTEWRDLAEPRRLGAGDRTPISSSKKSNSGGGGTPTTMVPPLAGK
jgi:hypothetical protein